MCSALRPVGQQVKYTGFRAITAGLQADTFIEAFDVEKQKQEYSALLADREEHAAMVRTSVHVLFVSYCVGSQVQFHHTSGVFRRRVNCGVLYDTLTNYLMRRVRWPR
jgi:hypothetical protein